MSVACNVCNDSKILVDNPMLICKSCGVATHRICYRVKELREGQRQEYYCRACKYFECDTTKKKEVDTSSNSQKVVHPQILPIYCQLCPVKGGAFIQTRQLSNETTEAKTTTNNSASVSTSTKWVHMSCARWHRLPLIVLRPSTTGEEVIVDDDDVQRLKVFCRNNMGSIKCSLCYGKRGAYQKCKVEGCQNYLHVSCARAIGFCEVVYGENAEGPTIQAENPWTLMCLFHSDIVFDSKNPNPKTTMTPQTKLMEAAMELPDEDMISHRLPSPHYRRLLQKPFHELTGEERAVVFSNPEYEKMIVADLLGERVGGSWIRGVKMNSEEAEVDSSKEIASNGEAYKYNPYQCNLCGLHEGRKIKSFATNCKETEISGARSKKALWIHVRCARQLGLEVNRDDKNVYGELVFVLPSCVKVFVLVPLIIVHFVIISAQYHVCGSNGFGLREKIEDIINVEKRRRGNKIIGQDAPMNIEDASNLMYGSIIVVSILGWAWRWAEWWVGNTDISNIDKPDTTSMKDKDFPNSELEVSGNDNTAKNRCEDARRCRLAAFGAALRNRNYDLDPNSCHNQALDRAIRAVLHTPSLVGNLKRAEIDFLTDWLGRAYRSKSKLLGLGNDKLPVNSDASFCVHIDDKTPKYELGDRSLPGKRELGKGQLFESNVSEPDDYLKLELATMLPAKRKRGRPRKLLGSPMKSPGIENSHSGDEGQIEPPTASSPKRKRGRPRKLPRIGDLTSDGVQVEPASPTKPPGKEDSASGGEEQIEKTKSPKRKQVHFQKLRRRRDLPSREVKIERICANNNKIIITKTDKTKVAPKTRRKM